MKYLNNPGKGACVSDTNVREDQQAAFQENTVLKTARHSLLYR